MVKSLNQNNNNFPRILCKFYNQVCLYFTLENNFQLILSQKWIFNGAWKYLICFLFHKIRIYDAAYFRAGYVWWIVQNYMTRKLTCRERRCSFIDILLKLNVSGFQEFLINYVFLSLHIVCHRGRQQT